MTTHDDRWTDDMAIWDAELERVLGGAMPSPDAPAWCTDVAVLVRTAQAPAQPDEMRGQDDIVARMTGLRLAVLAGDEPDDYVPGIPVLDVPAEVDLRTPPAVVDELAARRAEEAYTAKHSDERGYTAKHAAARLEASRHPAARTLGRVLAIKAVAITTAAVVGVAAAAATTGLVATVVVPAISDSTRRPIDPTPATTTDHGGDDDDGGSSGSSGGSRSTGGATEDCEVTVTCSPATTASTLPPASTPTTLPAGAGTTVPGRSTPPESTTTSTTEPSTATTVAPPPDTTTTTSTTVADPLGPTTLGSTSSSDL